ncbi:glycosyltransferase [Streptomyces sp. NPDC056661]|uniref:glycosyltransferase n=1 Tax=Streptomyces sp. NPDC056661 TaxID=3345898 RepID=UPI0036BB1257
MYRRTPDPQTEVAFEAQADQVLATIVGPDLAADVHQLLTEIEPDLFISDCMLPAALTAAEAAGIATASVVHFLYGPIRAQMTSTGTAWFPDLPRLNMTRATLGLVPLQHPLQAWEAADVLLVTAPRWLDTLADFPTHVVHAGPLGIRRPGKPREGLTRDRARVLISFSTTVMDGQRHLVQAACDAVAEADVTAVLTLGPALSGLSIRAPENVTMLPFADHDGVLTGADAVINHAGLGTSLRSLAHGIPQLMLPLGRDQHLNADRIARLGAGLVLAADSSPARIRAALERLMGEDHFRSAAVQAAGRIAAGEPDLSAAWALERACECWR